MANDINSLQRENELLREQVKKLVALSKDSLFYINKAFDYEGDVFGVYHNDAVDCIIELETILASHNVT